MELVFWETEQKPRSVHICLRCVDCLHSSELAAVMHELELHFRDILVISHLGKLATLTKHCRVW